jgi:selenocysteine lyase/cysteine desulfurase
MQALDTKFYENPSSGCRADTCGQTDRYDKLRDAFRDYANAPQTRSHIMYYLNRTTLANSEQGQTEKYVKLKENDT